MSIMDTFEYKNDLLNELCKCGGMRMLFQKYSNLTDSQIGLLYECAWDLVIKLGYLYEEAFHFVGKPGYEEPLINIKEYLNRKLSNGNTGGCADILFKKSGKQYFVSCKYHKITKHVQYYGIEQIITSIHAYSKLYYNPRIILLVRNKEEVWKKFKNARSPHITQHIIPKNIYDMDDLEKCLSKLFGIYIPIPTQVHVDKLTLVNTICWLSDNSRIAHTNMTKLATDILNGADFPKQHPNPFIRRYPRLQYTDKTVEEILSQQSIIETIFNYSKTLKQEYSGDVDKGFIRSQMICGYIQNTDDNKKKLANLK